MSATNKKQTNKTESQINTLHRLVLANMLWEDQFYMDGISTADLIKGCIAECDPVAVSDLCVKARNEYKLRHVPLLLARELARHGQLKANTLAQCIQRPDELSEFLSLYWLDGKQALSNQVKLGLAKAFTKFNEYELAKWDKNSAAIKLRDVMFLVHPKPATPTQADLFKRLANRQLVTPDTWETQLSAGADKCATFTRLLQENKLGALAFLRNLRNMTQCGVEESLILDYSRTVDVSKVLPFRFIAAARVVPRLEPMLEQMMFRATETMPKLKGKTVLVVDVSGSMFGAKISQKSDLDRFDAAAALAVLCREICEQVEVYTFSNYSKLVPARRGFALVDSMHGSQPHGGTQLGKSMEEINRSTKYDRVIVFTDEQSYDTPKAPNGLGYLVNVASYQKGINHNSWLEVNGFSEAIIQYIQAVENQ
jgi:60 kDa SS-A/Ro ribonucleoprotein